MTLRKMHMACTAVRFLWNGKQEGGKTLKATTPGFHYHTTISKNLTALLFSERLHIVSSPSQSIIILVKPKCIVFTIYSIKTNPLLVIWKIEGFWGIWLENKSSITFPGKILYCASQVYLLYSTDISDTLHVQVIVKPRFLKAVHFSQTYKTENTSLCHSHGRKINTWINTWIFTTPKINCANKTAEDQGRHDNSFNVERVFCIINKIPQE